MSGQVADPAAPLGDFAVHLLDVGEDMYGECALCRFGATTVLIDGGHAVDVRGRGDHPSIPDQLAVILGHGPPFGVSLLIVTHAHSDHIGCLPKLVLGSSLRTEWALVTDPVLGWGRTPGDSTPDAGSAAGRLEAALREESHADETDDGKLAQFLGDAASLESDYIAMLRSLASRGTRVVRYRDDQNDLAELQERFAEIGLRVLGPSLEQLLECTEVIARQSSGARDMIADTLQTDPSVRDVDAYRARRALAFQRRLQEGGGAGHQRPELDHLLRISPAATALHGRHAVRQARGKGAGRSDGRPARIDPESRSLRLCEASAPRQLQRM